MSLINFYETMFAVLNLLAHAHGFLPMLTHIPLLLF